VVSGLFDVSEKVRMSVRSCSSAPCAQVGVTIIRKPLLDIEDSVLLLAVQMLCDELNQGELIV
jgi:hypothetical protein